MKRAGTMFTALLLFLAWGAAPARAYTLNSNDPNMHGWKTDVLKVNLSLSDCPSEVDLPSIVLDAMKVWNEVDGLNIKLQLNNVASTTSAQKARAGEAKDAPVIACDPSFGTDTTMDPAIVPGVGGVAVSSSNEEIIYGYVILNTQPNTLANIESLDRNRLTIVVAHELGHLLGLGHSTDPQALMFPNVTNLTRAALAQDDLNGIWHLYGPGATRESTPGCGTISNKLPPDEYDTHIGAFLFTALLCGVGLRLMRGSRAID